MTSGKSKITDVGNKSVFVKGIGVWEHCTRVILGDYFQGGGTMTIGM